MRLIYILLTTLVSLLLVIFLLAITPEIEGATGVPHPEFKGMMISPNNIDQSPLIRQLGYFFGLGIIILFGVFLFIGNRKRMAITSVGKWLWIGVGGYILVYTAMVVSNWSYSDSEGHSFIFSMPTPTAWMIFGAWLIPLIITIAYVVKFDEAIISEEEMLEFREFLRTQEEKEL